MRSRSDVTNLFERALRAVTVPVDRFHWLLGARAALAFAGPVAVAHVSGRGQSDAMVIAVAGLLVALLTGSLPGGRVRRLNGAAVVAALPLVSALYLVVPAHHPLGVVVMAIGCFAATLAPLRWPTIGVGAAGFTLALLVAPRLPNEPRTTVLLLAGGALALAIVAATDALCHPRLRLPALPATGRVPTTRDEVRRHALRVGATIAVAATIALLAGDGSTFTARSSWMLLGAWIALQPQQAATWNLALQRGVGTAVGAALTIPLALAVPPRFWIGWVLVVLVFISFGLRTVNYAWYCVVLSPIVVLGFSGQPLDQRILAARVLWTATGVLLAVIVRSVLWAHDADALGARRAGALSPERAVAA